MILVGSRLVSESDTEEFVKQRGIECIDNSTEGLKRILLNLKSEKSAVYADFLKDLCENGMNINKIHGIDELIDIAVKNKLFFKFKHGGVETPEEFAQHYYKDGYSEANYGLVDYTELKMEYETEIAKVQQKMDKLTSQWESIDSTATLTRQVPTTHIKHDYCFSNYTERFKNLTEYWCNEEDFWFGTDTKAGYTDELSAMKMAIDARKDGKSTIDFEVGTDYWRPYYYRFFVTELLSQERVSLLYEDFKLLLRCRPDLFEQCMEDVMFFAEVYTYLCDHNSLDK